MLHSRANSSNRQTREVEAELHAISRPGVRAAVVKYPRWLPILLVCLFVGFLELAGSDCGFGRPDKIRSAGGQAGSYVSQTHHLGRCVGVNAKGL